MLKRADDEAKVEFRGYTSARGDVMLDVYVNDDHAYRFGPFDNKQQRMALIESLRASLGIRMKRYQ